MGKKLALGGAYVSVQQRADPLVGLQAAGGHESEGEQPLGKETPDDPLAGNRKAVRHAVHQSERECGKAAASGAGSLHHPGGVRFLG